MNKDVLVVGGGITGITCALELAQAGVGVHLIEKASSVGGLSASFACKATEECNMCSVCVSAEKIKEAQESEIIRIMPNCSIDKLDGTVGDFSVSLYQSRDTGHSGEKHSIRVGAVILATGAEVFDARKKALLGYGRFAGVITGLDLETLLAPGGIPTLPSKSQPPKRVAFIQCVGSRDENINQGYCSQVCCKYAMRMARVLMHRFPEIKITIFYIDLQTAGKGFKEFFEECQTKIEFIQGIPAKVSEFSDGVLEVKYDDIARGKFSKQSFDIVVLSVGIVSSSDAKTLARILGINRDRYGFFNNNGSTNSVETNREGIFVAGTCQGPKDITQSMAQAGLATAQVLSLLQIKT